MSEILQDTEDKSLDKKLGFLRLLLMILQFLILLNNFENQIANVSMYFPQLNCQIEQNCKQIANSFQAATIMALVFLVMQLIVLYVGINRFRLKPSIFVCSMHVIGNFIYFYHSRWQFENIWMIWTIFSFIPLCSEIAVALITAKV